jgi:hypothetical protein
MTALHELLMYWMKNKKYISYRPKVEWCKMNLLLNGFLPKLDDCHRVGNGSLERAARNQTNLKFSPQRNISPPQDSRACTSDIST